MLKKMSKEQLSMLHEMEQRGFLVADARNYFEQMNPRNPRVCQVIRTPYIHGTAPVVGLTSTSKKDMNRDAKGYLNTGIVDLFISKTNDLDLLTVDRFEEAVTAEKLVSLADVDPKGMTPLVTAGGRRVGQRDAYGEVQRFASVCAELSHMKTLDEYIEEAMLISGMLGAQKPTPDDYWKDYVPNMIEQISAGEKGRISPITGERYRVVGRVVTSRDAMAWARHGPNPLEGRGMDVSDRDGPSPLER